MSTDTSVKEETTSIAERLRIAGDKAGSLKALAEVAEIPYPTLMRYLQGTEPKRDSLARIVTRLSVDGTWLLTGHGGPDARDAQSVRKNLASDNTTAPDHNTVYLPKFSLHLYRTAMESAPDFETRNQLIRSLHKSLFQYERYPVEKSIYDLIPEDERKGLAAFDYHDSRSQLPPVRVLVDLYTLKPKQSQRSLVMYEGSLYILKAKLVRNPTRTILVDESDLDPLPDLDIEELARDDAIIGRVVMSTYMG